MAVLPRLTKERARHALVLVVLGASYVVAGKLGLSFATVHPSASALWAPTGIALAGFLLIGKDAWISIFMGAFIVNATTDGSLFTTLAIATGNTLEGYIGALLIERFANWPKTFERVRGVLVFASCGAIFAPMISATVGVLALAAEGSATLATYKEIWFTWWAGDAGGAMIVAPLLLLWLKAPVHFSYRPSRIGEVSVLAWFTGITTLIAFADLLSSSPRNLPIAFVCIPSILWTSYRFGSRSSATLVSMISFIAIWSTLKGFGPFITMDGKEHLVLLQMFTAMISLIGLVIAAVDTQRKNAESARERTEFKYRMLIEHSFDAVCLLKSAGTLTFASPSTSRILGYSLHEIVGTSVFRFVHPEEASLIRSHFDLLKHMNLGESLQMQFRVRHKNGSWLWLEAAITNLLNAPDIGAIALNFRDISVRKNAPETPSYVFTGEVNTSVGI